MISVAMLSEGLDAKNVTHIMGPSLPHRVIRFQLLCPPDSHPAETRAGG